MDKSIGNQKTMKPAGSDDRSLGSVQTMPSGGARSNNDKSLGSVKTMHPGSLRPVGRRFCAGDVILGRYRVTEELGQGGMGVVYRCFDAVAGIDVALKALPPEVAHNSGEMEEVRANFRLVSKLHHPNIANVNTLERDVVTGDYYLIMECVDGYDVRQWVRRRREDGRPLTLDEVTIIAYRIAEALDYAHEQGVIHRDIKPSNVRVNFEGEVKVLDFGLAAQLHMSLSRVSQATHGTSGTGPYMAPEQWRGQRQGTTADQYALAATVYELLGGTPPFENHDTAVLREAVLKDAPLPLKGVPSHVNAALLRGLDKVPEQRFESCAEFVKALAGSRRQETVDGSQKSEVRSRKWPWLVGLASFVTVATVAWMQHYGRQKAGDGSQTGEAGNVPSARVPRGQAGAAAASPEAPVRAFSSSSTPASPAADIATPVSPTPSGQPWTNSLGMVFVPVPGTAVRFSIWDTRVQDFSVFVNDRANNAGYDYRKGSVPNTWIQGEGWGERGWEYDWSNPGFAQTPLHPVVCMNWDDAQAFCAWLTAKERKEGKLSSQQSYRLPTDAEWSFALGIGELESNGAPKDKNRKVKDVYPWGTQWPPPQGAGNYATVLHVDDYDYCTAPVGSFAANRYGLYDMGGNAWKWCEDLYDPGQTKRVQRGVGWGGAFDDNPSPHLLSSVRCAFAPDYRNNFQGFRVVLSNGDVSVPPASSLQSSTGVGLNNAVSWVIPTLPKADRDGWVTLFDGKHLYGCNPADPKFTSGQVYFKDGYLCVNDTGFSFDWKGENATIRARVKKINGMHVALHIGPCFAWYGNGFGISQKVSGRDRAPILISRKLMSKTKGFVDLELSMTGSQLEFRFNGTVVLTKQALPFEYNEKSVQVSTWKGLSQFERIEVKQ